MIKNSSNNLKKGKESNTDFQILRGNIFPRDQSNALEVGYLAFTSPPLPPLVFFHPEEEYSITSKCPQDIQIQSLPQMGSHHVTQDTYEATISGNSSVKVPINFCSPAPELQEAIWFLISSVMMATYNIILNCKEVSSIRSFKVLYAPGNAAPLILAREIWMPWRSNPLPSRSLSGLNFQAPEIWLTLTTAISTDKERLFINGLAPALSHTLGLSVMPKFKCGPNLQAPDIWLTLATDISIDKKMSLLEAPTTPKRLGLNLDTQIQSLPQMGLQAFTSRNSSPRVPICSPAPELQGAAWRLLSSVMVATYSIASNCNLFLSIHSFKVLYVNINKVPFTLAMDVWMPRHANISFLTSMGFTIAPYTTNKRNTEDQFMSHLRVRPVDQNLSTSPYEAQEFMGEAGDETI